MNVWDGKVYCLTGVQCVCVGGGGGGGGGGERVSAKVVGYSSRFVVRPTPKKNFHLSPLSNLIPAYVIFFTSF